MLKELQYYFLKIVMAKPIMKFIRKNYSNHLKLEIEQEQYNEPNYNFDFFLNLIYIEVQPNKAGLALVRSSA